MTTNSGYQAAVNGLNTAEQNLNTANNNLASTISASENVLSYATSEATINSATNNGNGTYTVYPYNPMPTINAYSSYVPKRISIISDKVLGSTDENINPFINVRASLENDDNENIENFEDASLIEEDLPF